MLVEAGLCQMCKFDLDAVTAMRTYEENAWKLSRRETRDRVGCSWPQRPQVSRCLPHLLGCSWRDRSDQIPCLLQRVSEIDTTHIIEQLTLVAVIKRACETRPAVNN